MNTVENKNTGSAPSATDPFRLQLQEAAKTFKSNWVHFGELLTRIAAEKTYQAWGYRTFEAYCLREIRIKKATAIKLTNAYFFITEEDPAVYEVASRTGGPDLDVVSFLHKVKSDQNCAPEVYQELKETALEKEQTGTTLARRFRELSRREKNETAPPEIEQSLALISRLQEKLKPLPNLPPRFNQYLEEMERFFEHIKNETTDDE
jgi:hypothetical protein